MFSLQQPCQCEELSPYCRWGWDSVRSLPNSQQKGNLKQEQPYSLWYISSSHPLTHSFGRVPQSWFTSNWTVLKRQWRSNNGDPWCRNWGEGWSILGEQRKVTANYTEIDGPMTWLRTRLLPCSSQLGKVRFLKGSQLGGLQHCNH